MPRPPVCPPHDASHRIPPRAGAPPPPPPPGAVRLDPAARLPPARRCWPPRPPTAWTAPSPARVYFASSPWPSGRTLPRRRSAPPPYYGTDAAVEYDYAPDDQSFTAKQQDISSAEVAKFAENFSTSSSCVIKIIEP